MDGIRESYLKGEMTFDRDEAKDVFDAWEESKHPRERGRFARKGTSEALKKLAEKVTVSGNAVEVKSDLTDLTVDDLKFLCGFNGDNRSCSLEIDEMECSLTMEGDKLVLWNKSGVGMDAKGHVIRGLHGIRRIVMTHGFLPFDPKKPDVNPYVEKDKELAAKAAAEREKAKRKPKKDDDDYLE